MLEAEVRIKGEGVKNLYRALLPESEVRLSDRSEVEVRLEGDELLIKIKARDISALRAALNSYLYWAFGALSSLEL